MKPYKWIIISLNLLICFLIITSSLYQSKYNRAWKPNHFIDLLSVHSTVSTSLRLSSRFNNRQEILPKHKINKGAGRRPCRPRSALTRQHHTFPADNLAARSSCFISSQRWSISLRSADCAAELSCITVTVSMWWSHETMCALRHPAC